jgi:hypothetical protein
MFTLRLPCIATFALILTLFLPVLASAVDVTLQPNQGPVGTRVTATGRGWSPGTAVSIYVESQLIGGPVTTDAGGTFTTTFCMPQRSPGLYPVFFTNGRENFNPPFTITAGTGVNCQSSTGLPDLSPTAILYKPADLVPGRTVFFDSGIQNSGSQGTGGFNIRWFVDGVSLGYGSHAGVPANSTVLDGNSQFSWVATAGTHMITFAVDVDNHVVESNESNNSISITVTVTSTNQPPTAKFTMSVGDGVISAQEGETLNLTVGEGTDGVSFNSKIDVSFSGVRSSNPEGKPLTYKWQINTSVVGTSSDFIYALGQGTHKIELTVQDNGGVQSTASATIVITARNGATQPISLSWPFISTEEWNKTAGNEERQCTPGTIYDHCGDDWFAEDWNWGGANDDRGIVLLSPSTGQVIFTGVLEPGYGRQVIIQNLGDVPYDRVLRFTHLEQSWVTNDQNVCPGTPIGTIGFSGLTTGGAVASHLHVAAYMGVFQNSDRGLTGYHWLSTNGSYVEAVNVKRPTRFALDFNFDQNSRPQGCGNSFALQGRVITSNGGGIGGVTITLTNSQDNTVQTATTFGDNSGHFAFNALVPGTYTMTPNKTGCQFTPANISVTVADRHINLSNFQGIGAQCR